MAENANKMENIQNSSCPSRGSAVDYKKLAGLNTAKETDVRSVKSTKSVKSMNSGKSTKKKMKGKTHTDVVNDGDSRQGDFESEDDSSLGSDQERMDKLQRDIDALQPTMAERYNEYKVQQGMQDRLKDCDLPEELEKD